MVNQTAPAAAPPPNVAQSELIIIHVCDEARQINRDFACDRSVLLEEMKYFQSYLGGESGSFDDIDISVHCDVHIFEWRVPAASLPEAPPRAERRSPPTPLALLFSLFAGSCSGSTARSGRRRSTAAASCRS